MKIDDKLNLVSVTTTDNGPVYFHAVPLPFDVVEDNIELLAELYGTCLHAVGASGATRIAASMLRKRIKLMIEKAILPADRPTIIDDIGRMVTVIFNSPEGWKSTDIGTAIARGVITAEDYREVESEIVFFMVGYAVQKKTLFNATIQKALELYDAQFTSLSATGFKGTLQTSNVASDIPNLPEAPQLQDNAFIPS